MVALSIKAGGMTNREVCTMGIGSSRRFNSCLTDAIQASER
jgi:hypothetical protein